MWRIYRNILAEIPFCAFKTGYYACIYWRIFDNIYFTIKLILSFTQEQMKIWNEQFNFINIFYNEK